MVWQGDRCAPHVIMQLLPRLPTTFTVCHCTIKPHHVSKNFWKQSQRCSTVTLPCLTAPAVRRRQSAVAYWIISLHIGRPLPQNKHGHLLGHVKNHGG